MKKKYIKIIISAVTIAMLGGIGISLKDFKPTKSLSEAEKIEILNEIKVYDTEDISKFIELKNLIDENIEFYSEEERDIMINKYSNAIYASLGYLNEILYKVGYDLEDVIEKYNIDVTNPKTYKNIPKDYATIKGFLEEVHTKGFILKYSNDVDAYIITANQEEIYDKYGDLVSNSLAKMLEFSAYEAKSENVINSKEETVNLDEVAKRITMIEEGVKADVEQGYDYIASWIGTQEEYYGALIGANHTYFVANDYLKQDIFNKYVELQEKYKDTQLGTVLEKIIEFYKSNGKKADSNSLKKVMDIIDAETKTEEIETKVKEYYDSVSKAFNEMMGEESAESVTEGVKTEENKPE